MTENPVPSGNPDFPTTGPGLPDGSPPPPYPYPPAPYPPAPYQGGPYPGGPYQGGPYPGAPYPDGPYQGVPYQGGPYPGGYPPPPMQYGDYYSAAATAPKNGLGIAALVVAIVALISSVSVFGGILLGIVAVILGVIGRGRVKRGEADNGGVALAGIILGIISIIAGLAFIAIWVGLFKDVGGGGYIDCLQRAGQDRTAVQQCSDQFRESMTSRFTDAPTP